jgi:bifunctional DNA-binding transcriptional regulator/antitoxin component of YhaV-PrlF toxin-antitoxin module
MRTELARSKVTAQEQTSVPVEVRKRFGIKSGCEIGWYEEDGRLFVDLARTHTLADIRAIVQKKPGPPSRVDTKDSIRAHVAEKFERAGR